MTREYIASANTVDEAFEIACRELGVQPDEISSREVLQLPKKGLFGKLKQQAKVKVVVEDETPVYTAPKPVVPAASAAPAVPVAPVSKAAPAPVVSTAAAPAAKPAEKAKSASAIPTAPVTPATPAEEKTAAPVTPEKPTVPDAPVELTEEELADIEPKIEIAQAYLSEIFEKMGAGDVTMEFTKAPDRTVIIHLDGESIGSVIGKRGETLDSLQYLVCLVANRLRRREGDYVRFTMNAGNYREKREETLRALAARMAKKALKTGRPVALEPMNPYERRIIHAVITDIEGVTSKSTGEEPNRKVIIKPTRMEGMRDNREGRDSRSRRDGGRFKRDGGRGPRRDRAPASSVPRENREPREVREPHTQDDREPRIYEPGAPIPEPLPAAEKPTGDATRREAKKLDDSVKLYGKIEL